jgi:hypothetical protein
MLRSITKGAAIAALAFVAIAPQAVASTSSAGEVGPLYASCNSNAPGDRDAAPNEQKHVLFNGVNIRTGSSLNCGSRGTASVDHNLDYHCYTPGDDGRNWTFLRNARTNVQGWVPSETLNLNPSGTRGSRIRCSEY